MTEKWVDPASTEPVTQLVEEIRMRDQSGEVDLVVDVLVDPKVTIYTQASFKPWGDEYRDPRTRVKQKLELGKLKRLRQTSADLKLGNVSTGVIQGATVGKVYLGEEIGLQSGVSFLELTKFDSILNGGVQRRLDRYIPLSAVKVAKLQVLPQEQR